MISRRRLLKNLSALPFLGGLAGAGLVTGTQAKAMSTAAAPLTRNLFKELGIRTFINAAGTYTAMTGSLMPKEVTDAIRFGATEYVNLDDLQDKVGERIAQLLDCEYATVSSGCFGAITIGTAGVVSGMNKEIVEQLPDTTGLKNEVIVQESHVIGYCHAITNVGVKLVIVKSRKDLNKAINDKTAMMWFLNAHNDQGEIKHEEWVEVGKKQGVATFIDCAADVPPVENLFKYTKMGFDLVAFSGGKGIRGPQSAGLLLGRKDLIKAARLHTPPRGATLARGMKVNKEEVLGMLMALEIYLSKDHAAEWKMWDEQINLISDSAASVDGVEAEKHVPEIANHVPSLRLTWDQKKVKITPNDFREKLRMGHPSIQTVGGEDNVGITTWMMVPGQERIVARRIQEILESAV